MPAKQPGRVEDTAQRKPESQRSQAGILFLCREKLKDGKRDPTDENQKPDGKHVSGRDEKNLKPIGDFASVLTVKG